MCVMGSAADFLAAGRMVAFEREEDWEFGRDVEALKLALANTLKSWVSTNDKMPASSNESPMFRAAKIPNIRLGDYLQRIFQYALASKSCYVAALIYLQRLANKDSSFRINSYTAHRLIITSVVLAVKFHEDEYYTNDFYARVGGVTNQEFNTLEIEMLMALGFRLSITKEEFEDCEAMLRKNLNVHAATSEAKSPANGKPQLDALAVQA